MEETIKVLMKSDFCDDLEEELLAAKYFLTLCVDWLPQGLLRDTVRQVSEGRSMAGAWRALEDMGGVGGG